MTRMSFASITGRSLRSKGDDGHVIPVVQPATPAQVGVEIEDRKPRLGDARLRDLEHADRPELVQPDARPPCEVISAASSKRPTDKKANFVTLLAIPSAYVTLRHGKLGDHSLDNAHARV